MRARATAAPRKPPLKSLARHLFARRCLSTTFTATIASESFAARPRQVNRIATMFSSHISLQVYPLIVSGHDGDRLLLVTDLDVSDMDNLDVTDWGASKSAATPMALKEIIYM